MKKNPYDVLGIGRCADTAAIKSAYRRAAKQSHPDLAAPTGGVRRFREIQEAYETLKDRQRRKRCDQALDRLAKAPIDQIAVTDTIPLNEHSKQIKGLKVLSVASMLGEAIKRIHRNESVSSLFQNI